MITPTMLYIMTRADDIKFTATAFFVLTLIFFCFLVVGYVHLKSEGYDDESAVMAKLARLTAPFVAVFMAVAVLVPNTREVAAIIVIPRIANSESVEKIGTGIVDLATAWLEELKPQPNTEGK